MRTRTFFHRSVPVKRLYQIALLDDTTQEVGKTVFQAETVDEILAWVAEWLTEPIGLSIVVRPPQL